jgi:hypothetical protein
MAPRRALAGLLAAPVLVLTGCGDGSSVADPPVHSPPHSVATSDPPAHETAEHFIRRWAEEDTRIQQTGDTRHFREMSRGCRGCNKLAGLVERIYAAGGFIHTKGWTVERISRTKGTTFDVYVFSAATTYSASKGGRVEHLPSGPAHFQLTLRRPDSWHVSSLVQVAS